MSKLKERIIEAIKELDQLECGPSPEQSIRELNTTLLFQRNKFQSSGLDENELSNILSIYRTLLGQDIHTAKAYPTEIQFKRVKVNAKLFLINELDIDDY
jgi:hypothetical protein